MKTPAAIIAAVVMPLTFACNATVPVLNELQASNIPGGLYQGTATYTYHTTGNNETIDSGTSSDEYEVSYSNSGIPLDFASGQPERPGLEATSNFGFLDIYEKTESIVVSGDTVKVTYEVSITIDGIPLMGRSTALHTLQLDGSILVTSSMYVASENVPDVGVLTWSLEQRAVVTR